MENVEVIVGKFKVGKRIARGSFGEIYLGTLCSDSSGVDLLNNSSVAIKMVYLNAKEVKTIRSRLRCAILSCYRKPK
jgi:hypothetical protein